MGKKRKWPGGGGVVRDITFNKGLTKGDHFLAIKVPGLCSLVLLGKYRFNEGKWRKERN